MLNNYQFVNFVSIGIGASVGAWTRWGAGMLFNALLPNLPLGTLIVNVSGGLMIGVVLGLTDIGILQSNQLRLLFVSGFLGGLTTFSAFSGESLTLLQKHQYLWAAIHTSSHVLGALLMAAFGYSLVQYLKSIVF